MAISKDNTTQNLKKTKLNPNTGRLLLNIPFYAAVKTGDETASLQNCNTKILYH